MSGSIQYPALPESPIPDPGTKTVQPLGFGDALHTALKLYHPFTPKLLEQTVDTYAGWNPTPDYDPWADPRMKNNPGMQGTLGHAKSAEEFSALLGVRTTELAQKAELDASGAGGIVAQLLVGATDPYNIMLGLAQGPTMLRTALVERSAFTSGAVGAGVGAVQGAIREGQFAEGDTGNFILNTALNGAISSAFAHGTENVKIGLGRIFERNAAEAEASYNASFVLPGEAKVNTQQATREWATRAAVNADASLAGYATSAREALSSFLSGNTPVFSVKDGVRISHGANIVGSADAIVKRIFNWVGRGDGESQTIGDFMGGVQRAMAETGLDYQIPVRLADTLGENTSAILARINEAIDGPAQSLGSKIGWGIVDAIEERPEWLKNAIHGDNVAGVGPSILAVSKDRAAAQLLEIFKSIPVAVREKLIAGAPAIKSPFLEVLVALKRLDEKVGGWQPLTKQNFPDEIFGASTAGAAQVGHSFAMNATYQQQLEALGIKSSHTRLESLPINPIFRLNASPFLGAREYLASMLDFGGMHTNGNWGTQASVIPVERKMLLSHGYPLYDTLQKVREEYFTYRGRTVAGKEGPGFADSAKLAASDAFQGRGGLMSEREFNTKVGQQLHGVDTGIPEVRKAAENHRAHMDGVWRQAQELDLFTVQPRRDLATAESDLRRLLASRRPDPAKIVVAQNLVADLTDNIKKIRAQTQPPKPGNAPAYFPQVVRRDMSDQEYQGLKRVILNDLRIKWKGTADELIAKTDEVYLNLTKSGEWVQATESTTGMASALHERTIPIRIEKLMPYLDTDAEAIVRGYTRSMAADTEIARAFGGRSLEEVQREFIKQAEGVIAASPAAERAALRKTMHANSDDIRDTWARVRGTYGLPGDPESVTAGAVMAAKSFTYLTTSGAHVLMSLPDLARPIMTDGIGRVWGSAIMPMINGDWTALKMAAREARLVGEATQVAMGIAGLATSDFGSSFGKFATFNRSLRGGSSAMNILNLMGPWDDTLRRFASVVSQSRLLDDLGTWATTGKLDIKNQSRLQRWGIDRAAAISIHDEWQKAVQAGLAFNKGELRVAGTESWTNPVAVDAFRSALVGEIRWMITTPNIGDSALIMNTQIGSAVTMYKKFGLAATQKILITGLQENDAQFWSGSLAMIGMGAISGAAASAVGAGMAWNAMSEREKLMEAIDRSGVLGTITDAKGILARWTSSSTRWQSQVGSVGGPIAQQGAYALGVVGDVATGNTNYQTGPDALRLVPFASTLYWRDSLNKAARGLTQ